MSVGMDEFFQNRQDAGIKLSEKLNHVKNGKTLVLALPKGGVPVAAEIARSLNAELDLLFVRKIGAPDNPELGIGAVTEDQTIWLNEQLIAHLGVTEPQLTGIVSQKVTEIENQILKYRGERKMREIKDRTVILVDDGLATGATMFAAVAMLKKRGVGKIIVAIPTAAASTAEQLRSHVGEVIALIETEGFVSVGSWYQDFTQVSDKEILQVMSSFGIQKISLASGKVHITGEGVQLTGLLQIPERMKAMIIFAHGSGSSHQSPRNIQVAQTLNESGYGTLLFDLLTEQESQDRYFVFDIELLSRRLLMATEWIRRHLADETIPIGYFGASTGAAAALSAADQLDHEVFAIVSRGGRPDLAGDHLKSVKSPVLLIVGGQDPEVIELNRQAQKGLLQSELTIIPGATHVFPEPGALESVAEYAQRWFDQNLKKPKEIANAFLGNHLGQ